MEDALGSAFTEHTRVEGDDASLAEAAKADPQAFGELYERYYARVYRYIYHRLGNAVEAEDITAVVFMKALEALPSYQTNRNGFAPWLFRIARNALIDHYRRAGRQRPIDDLNLEMAPDDPEAEVLGNERRERLTLLVHALSREQREVVLMRYAADLSFSEIAAVMKKNEPAVRMLLHRGLRKIKAVLDDERP